jgi:hypothetical protein
VQPSELLPEALFVLDGKLLNMYRRAIEIAIMINVPRERAEELLHVDTSRELWVSALTVVLSEIGVLAVREVAVRVLHPDPEYAPLTLGPPIIDTALATLVAIRVFLAVAASHPNPVRTWRLVATIVLVISFAPDIALATFAPMLHGGWPEASALMVMHVVVWAICITVLPGLALTRKPQDGASLGSLSILQGAAPHRSQQRAVNQNETECR